MTTAALLIDRCRHRDIRLWSEDGRLRFDVPSGALDAELRAALVESKAAVLALLDAPHGGDLPQPSPSAAG